MSLYPNLNDNLALSSDEEIGEFGSPEEYAVEEGDRSGCAYDGQRTNYSRTMAGSSVPGTGYASSVTPSPALKTASPNHPRAPNNVSGTLSLADFEENYLHRRHKEPSVNLSYGHRAPNRKQGRRRSIFKEVVDFFERTSRWKLALIGCVLGLLFAVVYSELQLGNSSKDNLLRCPPAKKDDPCLTDAQLKPALLLARSIRDHLHSRAGQYECESGEEGVYSRNVTLTELQPLLPEEQDFSLDSQLMEHVFYLFLYNPHWGIRWLDSSGESVTSLTHHPSGSDVLESARPRVSTLCWLHGIASTTWTRIKIALIVILAVSVVVALVRWYIYSREQELKMTFIMVDSILDVLRRHYETSRSKKDLLPYLAIIHVRDMLIPPSERNQKQRVWQKACEWLAVHESRVRLENRRIAGEDFQVWRWIQEDPPSTEEPSKASAPPTNSPRRNYWQGHAFEDYPPSVETKVAPPAGSPSPCVRLKNMFEPTKRMEDEQALELENSVLDRCISYGGVIHIYVDRKSTFGCVYLKMDSVKAATGAYKSMHGGWYKGKLVTAKYIPEPKYHKWFPHAATATKRIYPS